MSRSRPLVICAQQRSGTAVLRSNLRQSPLTRCYDEVFLANRERSEFNFFNFKEGLLKEDLSLFFPSAENQQTIFRRFIDFLDDHCDTPFFVLDIKYNSWHHLDPVWHGVLDRPFLLTLLLEREVSIVHMIRQNVFQQRVSNEFAQATKQWHFNSKHDAKPKDIAIEIDPDDCQAKMELSQKRTELFRNWFSGHKHYGELMYEEMFTSDGEFSDDTLQLICDLVGTDIQMPTQPGLKKGIRNVSQVISNQEALLQHFAQTSFAEMVTESLQV